MGDGLMTAVAAAPAPKGELAPLILQEIPIPEPAEGQVLVRVRAAGVNRPDLLQRYGLYPPPPGAPDTLGLEIAGEVAAIGRGAGRWREGDAVTALLPGGGYAQYAVVDARHALPVPPGLNWEQAASLPETVFTVWANVFDIARLEAEQTLLVHGATSGIGVMAVQMAKAAGARVIATSRGPEKAAQAHVLGADLSIDSQAEDFEPAVERFGGADVALDMVGAAFTAANLRCLKPFGRLVEIATLTGAKAEVDLSLIMRKRLTLTGSTLRARPADEKARLARAVEQTVWPWIEAGKVRPVIDSVFPLADVEAAHARLEAGGHFGKVVLKVGTDAA
ncbi:MAG TPA: NAD(P)H-quinone oxidoreductase [Caulobacteraceae bacterium]|jgi:putative PIG3 family NAD(P)H quinone oxidoreductase